MSFKKSSKYLRGPSYLNELFAAWLAFRTVRMQVNYLLNLSFNLLKIEQIRIVQIGEFIYRYEHNLLPAIYRH